MDPNEYYNQHRRHKPRHHRSHRRHSNSTAEDTFNTATSNIYPSLDVEQSESVSSVSSPATESSRHRHHHHRRRRRGILRGILHNGIQQLNNRLSEQISMYNQQNGIEPTASFPRPTMERSYEYHRGRASSDPAAPDNEMHEFIRVSPSEHDGPPPPYNPYAPPPTSIVASSIDSAFQLFQRPINAINQVSNILGVRPPGDILYNATSHLPTTISSFIKPPGNAQPVYNYNHINVEHDRPEPRREMNNEVVHPPPPLPVIEASIPQTRLEPLALADVAKDQELWDIDALGVRVFKGGVENDNETRRKLWPYLLKLGDCDEKVKIYEVEGGQINVDFDWEPLKKEFEHYQQQHRSILPDQEKRFGLYREVKSLIQRDVIRCDRTHPFYQGEDNANLDKLRDLLLAYVMYDFDTGYVQGMSDLASPLLYVTGGDVCQAFWFFVKVMEFTKYNFEMMQTAIKLQHSLLWKLINITDPIFAQYLRESDGMHCYFAFRWFVCQFKREVMKKNDDGYHDVLLLWESIWTCSAMRRRLLDQKPRSCSSSGDSATTPRGEVASDTTSCTDDEDSESPPVIPVFQTKELDTVRQEFAQPGNAGDRDDETRQLETEMDKIKLDEQQQQQAETSNELPANQTTTATSSAGGGRHYRHSMDTPRLTDTQLYVLCICLAIIRRERDLILTHQYSNADILKHFNTLELNSDLKNILIHASNIWSWLVLDGNEELLYKEDPVASANDAGGDGAAGGGNGNNTTSGTTTGARNDEDFDLLSDLTSPSPINPANNSNNLGTSNAEEFMYSSA